MPSIFRMRYTLLATFLITVISSPLFAQQHFRATSNGGLCSYALSLYDDGYFSMENGCESSSHLTLGRWKAKKDTIRLEPLDNSHFKVIRSITSKQLPGDTITLVILDNKGVNITSKISAGLVTGNGTYFFEKDSSGMKKFVHKRPGGMISLKTLNRIFNQRFELDGNAANYYEVELNFPGEWIYNQRGDWSGIGPFLLLKKKDKLAATGPQFLTPLLFEPVSQ